MQKSDLDLISDRSFELSVVFIGYIESGVIEVQSYGGPEFLRAI